MNGGGLEEFADVNVRETLRKANETKVICNFLPVVILYPFNNIVF